MTTIDWRPGADWIVLQQRAELLASIRTFFKNRDVLEVDVPLVSRSTVTDLNIESIQTQINGESGFLQSSPEYFMKRLLVAGCDDMYTLSKAFRDEEAGSRHNPEFTLLEWYRLEWDEHQLMTEIADLICWLMPDMTVEKFSYTELFERKLGFNPHMVPLQVLQQVAVDCGAAAWADETRANCLDLLFSLVLEPELPMGLVQVYDYPACQAALASLYSDRQGCEVSRRFECFLDRVELANGYFELIDAEEQRQRFQADIRQRQQQGKPIPVMDSKFLAALDSGLPRCAGVAMGVDRLLMQMLGKNDIDEVMPFSWERC